MKSKKIVIFTGGSYGPAEFYENQLEKIKPDAVIAADSGLEMISRLNLTPALMVGDFDSVDQTIFSDYEKKGVLIKRHPVHKDQTDTALAVDCALEMGAASVVLFGATGTRIDHMLASLAAMVPLARHGIQAQLADPYNQLFLFQGPRHLKLHLKTGTTVSLTALSDHTGPVTLKGFAYPLDHQCLSFCDAGLTVSNFAAAPEQEVHFESGLLLIDVVDEKETPQSETAQ
ncbi:thiamine diphosphokinase [Pseudoramibacter sp.]|jgi:thiamine pyrophosphokinase|uniref:thiamine diphosphokinase n=1 Tax=Pseudoramibacter sp. TaxID=2034862 RepID=UPI0026015CE5|nr:thiamine diphosphokinase [Pseudoramibacter sp.]MCH4071959.1 thiamine diphosphokinase [Pseudoramibacter sp.]MCH4105727.1 thiamine diphosphokinase [Pseudoramibacter sp.]